MTAVQTREPERMRDEPAADVGDVELVDVRRSLVRRLATPGATLGSIASLLAAYLVVRMETSQPSPPPLSEEAAKTLVADVASLKSNVASLVEASRGIKATVDQVDRRTVEFEASVTLLRMSLTNAGFRLDAVEREVGRLQSRRE